jgi:hypothetical protein
LPFVEVGSGAFFALASAKSKKVGRKRGRKKALRFPPGSAKTEKKKTRAQLYSSLLAKKE